jgi:predicted RNA-binding protein YlqC (UPF0109 family)
MDINYELLVKNLVSPVILHPELINVIVVEVAKNSINITLQVDESDLGRTIGKGGKIASAIRTIIYAASSKESKHVHLEITSL